MSSTEELLRAVGLRIEAELKPRLSGLFGGMLRGYLPQVWEFRTEREVVALRVGPDGSSEVRPGPSDTADVTVEIPEAVLRRALTERRRDAIPPGTAKVTARTSKGRTAFDFLRSRFGL